MEFSLTRIDKNSPRSSPKWLTVLMIPGTLFKHGISQRCVAEDGINHVRVSNTRIDDGSLVLRIRVNSGSGMVVIRATAIVEIIVIPSIVRYPI